MKPAASSPAPLPRIVEQSPARTGAHHLPAVLERLAAAQRRLAARPRAEIVDIIAGVVGDWLVAGSPWMARAAAQLPAATGFSPEMVRFALPAMLEPLRREELASLLDEQARGRVGPPLILHVLPGNLPGLAAIPAGLSLAIGSAALLKPGRGDRVFPSLFIESVAARDGELAAALAAPYWPGGERSCEDVALAAADLVVASGDEESVADLAQRRRDRFIGHGHRISFAVVTDDVDDIARSAVDLALDVATWDQRGCLSPQLAFIEGELDAAHAFGEQLACQLHRQAVALPPAPMSIGERLAVRRWRDEAQWASFDGEPYRLFVAGDEAAGTVVVEPRAALRPTPLSRSIRVVPLASFDDLPRLLAPYARWLEGAGLAASEERWRTYADRLEAAGVHLVSRLGAMQRPPLNWRHGGRPRVADWCVGADRVE